MAGIPVHTSSPISPNVATKASAITPSTTAVSYTPASAAATTAFSTPQSHSAQPSAPAVPQPTNTAAILSNNAPAPTPTQPTPESPNPPPSQPGAVPVPQNITHQRRESIPTSPRTASSQPIAPLSPVPLPPHQSSNYLSTPTRSVPPAAVTSTFSGPQDLSHPPGYIQNSRASFEDRPFATESNDSAFNIPGNISNRRSVGGAGILNGEMHNQENGADPEEQSVWDTAMTWAKAAGTKLSKTEEHIWKRVNGEK